MSTESANLEQWLLGEFATGLASVFEGMSGIRPQFTVEAVKWEPRTALPRDQEQAWRQPMPPMPGALYVVTSVADILAAGQHVMVAAGIDDSTPEELESTYKEALGQALSTVARTLTERLKQEVSPRDGAEASDWPAEAGWGSVRLQLEDVPVTIALGVAREFLAPLEINAHTASAAAGTGSSGGGAANSNPGESNSAMVLPHSTRSSVDDSRTFDLLLDVELPVSVSFGHAQVALKDVLKLTTGSIVELSRAIVEPVDVVVNNCVIARGEVVVVEGNFGVRIQQVASRNERLRSLQ
jgi:flagellar motor switch protein FliN/FliY